jgi:hypothetical protein
MTQSRSIKDEVNKIMEIPQEVYNIILIEQEQEQEKTGKVVILTMNKVAKYLQKYRHLGYNRYYGDVDQITHHLNGMQRPSVPLNINEEYYVLENVYQPPKRTSVPTLTHFPPQPHSFPKYDNCDQFKSGEGVDEIWEKICLDLGWAYYPSSELQTKTFRN